MELKIGILQQHNTADRKENMARLAAGIRQLAAEGAELVVLQELHNGLYFCQTENVDVFDQSEPIPGPSTEFYGALAKELGVVIVTSLFERRAAGLYHNTAVVIEKDGTMAGKYRKMHIPDDPAYYEKFYFTPGDLGFHPIQTSVGNLGVLVCWDQWYPEAARLMALQGAELLIYPTAIGYDSNDTPDEQERQREAWTTVQRGHAVANGLPVVTVNRVGWEDSPEAQNSQLSTVNYQLIKASNSGVRRWLSDRRASSSIVPRRTRKWRRLSPSASDAANKFAVGGRSCATAASMPTTTCSVALLIDFLNNILPKRMNKLLKNLYL